MTGTHTHKLERRARLVVLCVRDFVCEYVTVCPPPKRDSISILENRRERKDSTGQNTQRRKGIVHFKIVSNKNEPVRSKATTAETIQSLVNLQSAGRAWQSDCNRRYYSRFPIGSDCVAVAADRPSVPSRPSSAIWL